MKAISSLVALCGADRSIALKITSTSDLLCFDSCKPKLAVEQSGDTMGCKVPCCHVRKELQCISNLSLQNIYDIKKYGIGPIYTFGHRVDYQDSIT